MLDFDYKKFGSVIGDIYDEFRDNPTIVHTERWQAKDIKSEPSARMVEITHLSFGVDVSLISPQDAIDQIKPNLPWADAHFEERVCGHPINPGVEWRNWPWAHSADKHREDEMFNHNYMERYWPKYAAINNKPTLKPEDYSYPITAYPIQGLRGDYGDLNDLIQLLANEPLTRQAYFPIWFPEDTGNVHSGRKPCTLGYQFLVRNGRLDITYFIRSCDFTRHFRDDIYLTYKLQHYVINQCRKINPEIWGYVLPGRFIMHITSLHMFINDYIKLYGRAP